MQTPPPHRSGDTNDSPRAAAKTPQSTAGAENHSHLLPTHLFVDRRRFSEKELKEKSPFSAAMGFITRPTCFQSFRFRKEQNGDGSGRISLKRFPYLPPPSTDFSQDKQ
ncbi:hypothetical protein CEXT_15621 [Caerostris extrusa]|uniref:Uncharacterized protein n=1 Tax=Caerostris extrusa TaxID=172846 RepID=A0AAV4MBZ2_CAEEX|nr:hypothetical protein CEXT_15621 [Caerostris extrusa]